VSFGVGPLLARVVEQSDVLRIYRGGTAEVGLVLSRQSALIMALGAVRAGTLSNEVILAVRPMSLCPSPLSPQRQISECKACANRNSLFEHVYRLESTGQRCDPRCYRTANQTERTGLSSPRVATGSCVMEPNESSSLLRSFLRVVMRELCGRAEAAARRLAVGPLAIVIRDMLNSCKEGA
jgi:hypothetical protein